MFYIYKTIFNFGLSSKVRGNTLELSKDHANDNLFYNWSLFLKKRCLFYVP